VYTQRKIEAHSHNSFCRGKAANNRYSECVSSEVTCSAYKEHEQYYVSRQALPYFATLPHKGQDFRKHVTEHKMYVVIFCTIILFLDKMSKIIS
jgi:hypothetical protein